MKADTTNNNQTINRLHAIVQGLDDKKADQITVLDLEDRSSVARYFVIASATSDAHLNALRKNLEDVYTERFSKKLDSDAKSGSGWYVLDGDDAMIHLFTPAQREHYDIESLWGDAKVIPAETFFKDAANS